MSHVLLDASAIDLADPPLYFTVSKRDVPYVPTEEQVVRAMLRFAGVTAQDTLVDLGCGDGRIVIAAAKVCGARAIGVDIDPQRIRECRENARHARAGDRVTFYLGSMFDLDLSAASVVTLYLLPRLNVQLHPKFLSELQPGSRIVASTFEMGAWQPDAVLEAHHRVLRKYIVPARLPGRFRALRLTAAGPRHFQLNLTRHYQQVVGTARMGSSDPAHVREVPISGGKIVGRYLTFALPDPEHPNRLLQFAGEYRPPYLRGTWRMGTGEPAERPGEAWWAAPVEG